MMRRSTGQQGVAEREDVNGINAEVVSKAGADDRRRLMPLLGKTTEDLPFDGAGGRTAAFRNTAAAQSPYAR